MSNFRSQYKKQKQDLLRRHEESVAHKDSGQFGSICDLSQAPKGIGFWKCSSAKHIIDYIPFTAGDNMPKLFEGDPKRGVKEGEFAWSVDLWIHGFVGAMEYPYVCPAKTNGLPCPICEHLQENRGQYSKEEYDRMKAKRNTLHLIWCHDSAEEENKGVQIWQIQYYFMEQHVKLQAEKSKGGGTIPYFDPDSGKNVVFMKQGSDGKYTFLGHKLEDRDGPIPDTILDQSFPLDSIIKYAPYDEIYSSFYGQPADGETGDRIPAPALSVEEEEPVEDEPPFEAEAEGELAPDECPVGGEFGADFDQLEACTDNCPNWDNCYATHTGANAEPEQEPEQEPESEPEPPARKPSSAQRLRSPAAKVEEPVRKPAAKPIPRRRG